MALPEILSKGIRFSNLEPVPNGRIRDYNEHEKMVTACANALRVDFADKRGALPQGDTRVLMEMIELDTDFQDLVKYDEATGKIHHSSVYKSVDDIKIAILKRGGTYGLNLSRNTRDDILGMVLSRPGNTVNSVKMWVEKMMEYSTPADPLPKLLEYFKYTTPQDKENYNKFWSLFFRSTAVHIVSSYLGQPYPSEIVPVLCGKQGIGKTRFCEYLATSHDMYVDMGNKHSALGSPDSLRLMCGKIVVELGEMSLWRKTDAESVKSFVTQKVDSWVPKYKESSVDFKRSFFFIGNSNTESFLRDFSGNRRWFPVHVDQIHPDLFDDQSIIKQVWGYYLEYAQSLIMRGDFKEILIDKELNDFFEVKRSAAIDTGNDGDFLREIVLGIEVSRVSSLRPSEDFLWINPKEVAEKYYGESSRAGRQFKDILVKVCKDLGYETSVNLKEGKMVRKAHRVARDIVMARHSDEDELVPVGVPDPPVVVVQSSNGNSGEIGKDIRKDIF